MKLTTTILVLGMTSAMACAQAAPAILQNTKDKLHAVQEKKNDDIGGALGNSQVQTAKSASSQPAKAPVTTSAKPAAPQVMKAATSPEKKTSPSHTDAKPKAAVAVEKPLAKPTAAVAVDKPLAKPTTVKVSKAPVNVTPKAAAKNVKSAPKEAKSNKDAASKNATTDAVSVESRSAPEPSKNEKMKTITANGRRDPFVSPVVSQSATGSGCSTGKRCLAVDQISLKGVVKAETGMIAVVVNALDKAYFLRENDPVFDGYVLRITTDSIVFKETVQDKLGKPFTREVTKKITTPVV
jgi:Tfp pilus assembly protein PilP